MTSSFGKQLTDLSCRTLSCNGKITLNQHCDLCVRNIKIEGSVSGILLPGSVLVFRPGFTPNMNNIFGDWQSLYNAAVKIDGPKTIHFDDCLLSFGEPIIIPPGQWDMSHVTWTSEVCMLHSLPAIFTKINVSDGATVNGLCGIEGPILVNYFGTTEPAFIYNTLSNSRAAAFVMSYGAQVMCSGTQPFWRIDGGFFEIILIFSAKIYGIAPPAHFNPVSTVAPIHFNDNANDLVIVALGDSCVLEDNTISNNGVLNNTLLILRIETGAITSVPPVQPYFAGALVITSDYTSPDTYVRSIPPTNVDDNSKGYKIGDMWIDNNTNKFYVAVNINTGSAIWNGPY